MELDVSALISNTSSLMYSFTDFILEPVFLRWFSGSLHLLLSFVLFVLFVCNVLCAEGNSDDSKECLSINKRLLCYKQIVLRCLTVSVCNLVLCLLSYFYWYSSDYELISLLDSLLRTLSWVAVYLHSQFFSSANTKFPFSLRVFWAFYFSISCYCLVVDIVSYRKQLFSEVQYLALNAISLFNVLWLCYLGFLKTKSKDTSLKEPLLDGNLESTKSTGSDTVTPYSNAGLFSSLTFSWISSLIADGHKRTLNLEDVPQLYGGDSVVAAYPVFCNRLKSDSIAPRGVTTIMLVKALFFSAWKDILLTFFLSVVHASATYAGPYLIDSFVQCLNGQGEFKHQGYLLAAAFLVGKLAACLSEIHWYFQLRAMGIRIYAVLVTMIYCKCMTLSCQSKQGNTSGEIINLLSLDAKRISDFTLSMHDPWLVIFQIGLALFIFYKTLGLASLATFIAIITFMSLNYPLGRLQKNFQQKLMKSKDERMKTSSEILRNMRILKLQAWEMKFLSKIVELREIETGWLKKYVYTSSVVTFFSSAAPIFVSVITFATCMFIGISFESGKVLSALATFKILKDPIRKLPETISMMIRTKVSLDRIASFLQLDDLQSDIIEKIPKGSSDTAIEILDGNFSWDLSAPIPTLKDINFKAFHGMSVAVCGTVGSGKSSLLSCILGEVPKISGTIKLCGTKAYVAQIPWIQSCTIEENIRFGKEMDRERYDRILDACSLKKDLEMLSYGDQTLIGERGINLSGGQKQRVQIARALYYDADIYLFDDPFSALDAHTGSHLFKEVLLGLLSSKTVIYVTHQVEFLPAADIILVMKDGRITQAGKYNDICNSCSDFMELVGAHETALSALRSNETQTASENESMRKDNDSLSSTNGLSSKEEGKILQNVKADGIIEPKKQLVQEEEREKGRVGFQVYWKYLTAAYGGALVPIILLVHVSYEVLQIGSNYWMASETPASKDVTPVLSRYTVIIVYAGLAIGSSFCILIRSILLATAGFKTATVFFNRMHFCIFRAPMLFFDANPSGRILSRASVDQSAVDTQIPNLLKAVAFSLIQILVIIVVMSRVAWQVFIVFIPMVVASIWYQQFYTPSARELSRLVGLCKSPIIQHLTETISGTTTIRSFDHQSRFQETLMKLVDAYSRPKFHIAAAIEWLYIRIDMFSTITFAFFLFFVTSFPEGINPAIAGLAVTYGLSLSLQQSWVICSISDLENKIISVERILQYMSIPSEPPLVLDENRPDSSWPSHGEVLIDNLQVRYAPHMPLVLQGITCTFQGGKRTGIVGRTGSGKSTLVQTLFRIVDPAAGQIVIDGINISSIGLHDLRSKLSIIPQDPTMFEGTIKSNLDPLEEYTDEQIWEALDKCQLGNEVRKKEKKLGSTVTENGENWSMGQRQLVCLGRVLLKKSKVLVLDEATASVDTATDNLIQQTIRQHFSDCTVITIAHRITSVLDSDMVLLLSHGLIKEYDSPTRLLENKSSAFAQLVAEYTARSNTSFEKLT
ncbi:ABC transporter C family member 3-like [Mercurialis annua]|uniref:ABC transporter C family member 3-like n=1 Tax=Mercurialis annua TaxID=3986 RepID=UPI002160D298|nr:ABC transporter C family member 3-like [Mercurialis annua]